MWSPFFLLRSLSDVTVRDLKPDTFGHNIRVQVVEVKLIVERKQVENNKLLVAEALVGDTTGSILFTCKNGRCLVCPLISTRVLSELFFPLLCEVESHLNLCRTNQFPASWHYLAVAQCPGGHVSTTYAVDSGSVGTD
jgi:hypothetical protein